MNCRNGLRLGFLRNLDNVAQQNDWEQVLPEFVQHSVQSKGHYVAGTVGIHRVNWLWVNPKVFQRLQLTTSELDWSYWRYPKLKQAGITHWRLAMTSGNWRFCLKRLYWVKAAVIFTAVHLFSWIKPHCKGDTMQHLLELFHQLREYIADDYGGTNWNQATHMLIEGSAAMQLMGDWVKGELTAANVVLRQRYSCLPAPVPTDGKFSYNLDSICDV